MITHGTHYRLWTTCLAAITCLLTLITPTRACTTAVISGRITPDGRPLLWKNRDYGSAPRNEVAILTGGKYRAIAVVNAGSRSSIWMGTNEAGFCIENSLSTDLRGEGSTKGPSNGPLMKLALQTCATIDDFERLLRETNVSGRRTVANFGVIDAQGGAAMFETGPNRFTKFDANDPAVAPNGYIVRSNFATTPRDLSPLPNADSLSEVPSADRYLRACRLLDGCLQTNAASVNNGPGADQPITDSSRAGNIELSFLLQNMTRDLADADGRAIVGSLNAQSGTLPPTIRTTDTISRITTVSAAVFHGVRPDEDPRDTTMWAILGDPKFSIAVPCWPSLEVVAEPLRGDRGGEIGELARLLRDVHLTKDRQSVRGDSLAAIWEDILPLERASIDRVLAARRARSTADDSPPWAELHEEHAGKALTAMRSEMEQAKAAALRGVSARALDTSGPIRVAIYDHSELTARGPKQLLEILTREQGFDSHRVTPEDIRQLALVNFDVLIMPGGSGSGQAEKLEPEGRRAIRDFVARGGGYVGICAGAYLASTHYDWSLDILNARVWDRAHWARGMGQVSLAFTEPGRAAFQTETQKTQVYYGQGPLLIPGDNHLLPAYETLATYDSEIASRGAPVGAMRDTHAIVRAPFGQGRVICFSPHPESSAPTHHLITNGVRWVAGQ